MCVCVCVFLSWCEKVDSNGAIAVAELKAIFKQYVAETEGEDMVSDARIDLLLADAGLEAFRGKVEVSKLIDAMAFKR